MIEISIRSSEEDNLIVDSIMFVYGVSSDINLLKCIDFVLRCFLFRVSTVGIQIKG